MEMPSVSNRFLSGLIGSVGLLCCFVNPLAGVPHFLRSVVITDGIGDPRANPVIADLDGDGLKDIVYTDYDSIGWIRNLGNRQFGTKTVLETRPNWYEAITKVVVADMDGDQKPDIIYDANSAELHILFNKGNGQFSPGRKWYYALRYAYGTTVEDFVVADFDRDGDNDIVISSWSNGKIWLQTNVGAYWDEEFDTWVYYFNKPPRQRCLFWTQPSPFPEPPIYVDGNDARFADLLTVGDFDGDAWPDICFSSRDVDTYTSIQRVEIIYNPGEAPLTSDELYPDNETEFIGAINLWANQVLAVNLLDLPGDEMIWSYFYDSGLFARVRKFSSSELDWDASLFVPQPETVTRFDVLDVDGDLDMDVVALVEDPDYPNVYDPPVRIQVVTNNGLRGVDFDQYRMDSESYLLDTHTTLADSRFITAGDLDKDGRGDFLVLRQADNDCAYGHSVDVYFNAAGSQDGPFPSIWPDAEFEKLKNTDWWHTVWFGHYKTYCAGEWAYKPGLGWLYAAGGRDNGQWFWSDSRGWFWTSEQAWPAIYSLSASRWILY